jgi:hypothetical protein
VEGHDDPRHIDPQTEDQEHHREQKEEAEADDGVPQEHLRIAEEWQGSIAQVSDVSIPEEGYAVEDIGGET